MPLSFDSTSHGPVAFGFFNIQSDMLLLDRYFFFCESFCNWMITLAGSPDHMPVSDSVYVIERDSDIGDLMGAIHGIRFTGFIGQVYRRFPFPEAPKDFKQDPDGHQTRSVVEAMIQKTATRRSIEIRVDPKDPSNTDRFRIGPYTFTIPVCHELIRYVWQGGYPRWKDERQPAYVISMAGHLSRGPGRFFSGVFPSG